MTTTLDRPSVRLSAAKRESDLPVVFDTRVVTGSGGGPDKTILNTPRYTTDLGYRTLCGYLYPPNDPGYSEIERKAAKYGAPLISIPDRGPTDWRVVRDLIRVCKRERVAIWHGHDYKTNALGLLLKRFWPMKLVSTVHGWVHHTARTPLYYRVDKFCLPRYERVVCVSDDLYRECLGIGVREKRCLLIENGIDATEYTRKMSADQAKVALGLSPNQFVVGAVGRLEPEKAFDVLLQAVSKLHSTGCDVKLVIVGEGSDRSRLESMAHELNLADRVLLPGWQSDVRRYFEAMDLFALSSLREGLPNVLLEAMALGVPCVATRINGIPRLISDAVNGRLVSPNRVDELASAMIELAGSVSLRKHYAMAARETIETRYSFTARMQKMCAMYDDVLLPT